MVFYERMMHRIEGLAKGSAVATLFVLPISTSGTLILFLLTTLLILLSGHWKKKFHLIRSNPMTFYFFSFFALYLIGITYSIGTDYDIKQILLKFNWLLLSPLWLPLWAEDRWRQRALNAFLITMSVTLILSYIKYFHWIESTTFWHSLNARLSDNTTVFKDYIIQSFLMSLAAMLFLYRFMQKKQLGYGILFVLALFNILLVSQSRTGYIIFTLLLAYTLFSQLTLKKAGIIFGTSVVIMTSLLIILPNTMQQRVDHAIYDLHQWEKGHEKTSLGYRMAWQLHALELFKQRPLFGYGTGSIKTAYAHLPQQETWQTGIVNNTSNEYLNIAVQFGSAGLLLFLGLLILQWRYSFYLPKEYGLLIQTMLIALSIGNFANSWLMDFTQGYYYALMMGVAFGALPKTLKLSKATDRADNDDVAKDILA